MSDYPIQQKQPNLRKEALMNLLKSIWPTVYRIINIVIYTILKTITNGFRIAIEQLKGK